MARGYTACLSSTIAGPIFVKKRVRCSRGRLPAVGQRRHPPSERRKLLPPTPAHSLAHYFIPRGTVYHEHRFDCGDPPPLNPKAFTLRHGMEGLSAFRLFRPPRSLRSGTAFKPAVAGLFRVFRAFRGPKLHDVIPLRNPRASRGRPRRGRVCRWRRPARCRPSPRGCRPRGRNRPATPRHP